MTNEPKPEPICPVCGKGRALEPAFHTELSGMLYTCSKACKDELIWRIDVVHRSAIFRRHQRNRDAAERIMIHMEQCAIEGPKSEKSTSS